MAITCFLLILMFDVIASQEYCRAYLYPSDSVFVGSLGNSYIYSCQGWNDEDNVTVSWYINETLYSENSFYNIYLVPSNTAIIRTLIIDSSTTREHNHTTIMCSVEYSKNTRCNSTKSLFLVQGAPEQISNIDAEFNISCSQSGTIALRWPPSFSLNFSRNENNISYVVKVNDLQTNVVIEKTFDSSLIANLPDYATYNASCLQFNITIRPINIIGGGTEYSTTKSPLESESIHVFLLNGTYVDEDHFIYSINSNPAVCSIDAVVLRDMYDETKYFILSQENIYVSSDCNEDSMVVLNIQSTEIISHRFYMAEYLLPNEQSPNNVLSTHDIQNVTFDKGQHYLSVDYLLNSTAMGALLFFNSNNSKSFFLYIDKESSQYYNFQPTKKNCTVLAFDIESSGYLLNGINYPASGPHQVYHIQFNVSKNKSILECLQHNDSKIIVISSCICAVLSIEEMYQLLIVNSRDTSGKINVVNGDCTTTFNVNLTFYVTYYIAVFLNSRNKDSSFIQVHQFYLEPPAPTINNRNVAILISTPIVIAIITIATTSICVLGIYFYKKKRKTVQMENPDIEDSVIYNSYNDKVNIDAKN